MKCTICDREIINYDNNFHRLKIDDSHIVDICTDCVDKIVKWQGEINAKLFPTTVMKKRFRKS